MTLVEMPTRGENIDTVTVVGEVGPLIAQGRGPDGNGPDRSGGRVRTGVPVVVTGSDSEVHARFNGPVDSIVQSHRLATTQRHVGDRTLVLCLSGGSVLSLGSSELVSSLLCSPQNTANDISHGTTTVGTQDFDGNKVSSLGNTIFARANGTSAMGPVTVSVLVDVILRDGLSPRGATLKLDVVNVDTGIDDVDVDTLTAGRVVLIESKSSEAKFITMGDTRKTLKDGDITNHATTTEAEEHTHGANR